MTYPPETFGVIEISGALGGSLLVPATWKVLGAKPDSESAAVTVATWTILPFGGHSEQPGAGIPEMTGGVLSILIVTGMEEVSPAPFVAEQVTVTPAVSVVSAV
jgi:hypothetical protein